jgi:hypothetical protein
LVQRLLAASANLPNFIHDLILTQAHLVAGTEAAAFLVEQTQDEEGKKGLNLKVAAHIRPDDSDADTRSAALNAFQEIMKPCIVQGKDGAIQIEGSSDGGESQYCLVTLLRSEGAVVAASAVITRARDLERAQQRLTSMQLVAGYFDLFTLRRRDEQSRAVAQSHQHVLQLATAVATADGFDSAAMNLCNELAARTGAARVSLGWLKGNNIKLRALSHTEEFDKKQELSVQLVKVMEECLDNDEIVQYEPDGTTTETVTREASILSRAQSGETILSLPLRRKGEVVGVATLEFAPNQKIGPQAAVGLAVAVELLAPQLFDRFQNDRWLITKVGLSIRDLGEKTFRSPKYMLAKSLFLVIAAALAFLTIYKPMYHVKATFQFAPIESRKLSAPFESAKLWKVYHKFGDHVVAGEKLFEFEHYQLDDQLFTAQKEAAQKRAEAANYGGNDDKAAERLAAELEMAQAESRASYYEKQIKDCLITAPFDGEILIGDLEHDIGKQFKPSDPPLMEIGQPNALRAELGVDERDIQDVLLQAKGKLATEAKPSTEYPFTIERIVPLPSPKEGTNTYTVHATLEQIEPDWRPGMRGEARVDVRHERLIWIWTHKFVDWVRFKLWM